MRALLIEFDGASGRRPAGIEANDPKLQCYGWQQLDSAKLRELGYTPKAMQNCCLEVRVIEDDRDIAQYEGREAEGLKVLYDDAEIQAAIDQYMTPMYRISDEALFRAHLDQKKIKLDDVPGRDTNEQLKHLHGQGVKGVAEIRRPRLKEIYPAATTT